MFNLIKEKALHAVVLASVLGFATAATLTPAHAKSGSEAIEACIDNDECHFHGNDDGSISIVFDGGGVIWCPSLDGECVVVSPTVVKGTPSPVAAPIAAPITPGQNAGGLPVANPTPPSGTPVSGLPVINHPAPPNGTTGTPPTTPISGHPVTNHPVPPTVFHPVRNPIVTTTFGSPKGNGPTILVAHNGGGSGRH
jgi:hypothetical protein